VIGARALHHVEYLALTLVLVGAALAVRDELGWAYSAFLLARRASPVADG